MDFIVHLESYGTKIIMRHIVRQLYMEINKQTKIMVMV